MKVPVAHKDRFRIVCEASAEQMGVLLAHMARMGLNDIGYELVTDVPAFTRNNTGKRFEVSAEKAVRAFIATNPTFRVSDLIAIFLSEGRTKASVYGTVHKLVKDGVLVKLGDGNYQRSDMKALEAPSAKASKGKAR